VKKLIFLLIIFFSCQLAALKNFVLISAPGSGKGTFSQYLVEKYGYVHVCPGDMFRDEISRKTDFGKHIEPIVANGDYIDKTIVCKLMAAHLEKILEEGKKFILDGFPREEYSFNFLHNFFEKHSLTGDVCFLQFEADDDVCKERILGRVVCPQCFMVYNKESARIKESVVCDNCGSSLIARLADNQRIAEKRLRYFHSEIEPLLEMVKRFYEVIRIEAACSRSELEEKYVQLID